jgi:hypothetical protein
MTLTIQAWAVPLVATFILWLAIIVWPMPQRSGDYDFTGPLLAIARLGGGIILTLAFWLLFFIWKSW